MILNDLIGGAATLASIAFALLGLPHQIYRNWKQESCEGVAPTLIYAGVCTYTLWALYGWTKPDYLLACAQTPGAIFTWILVYQMFKYKKKAENE